MMIGFFQQALEKSPNKWDFKEKVGIFVDNGYKRLVSEKDFRKAIKKGYKISGATKKYREQFVQLLKHESLINHGKLYSKYQDGTTDYDSWIDWYLVEVPSDEEEEMKIQAYMFLKHYLEGVVNFGDERINSAYDCTGLTFSYAMEFTKVGKNRVLASKRYGVDV